MGVVILVAQDMEVASVEVDWINLPENKPFSLLDGNNNHSLVEASTQPSLVSLVLTWCLSCVSNWTEPPELDSNFSLTNILYYQFLMHMEASFSSSPFANIVWLALKKLEQTSQKCLWNASSSDKVSQDTLYYCLAVLKLWFCEVWGSYEATNALRSPWHLQEVSALFAGLGPNCSTLTTTNVTVVSQVALWTTRRHSDCSDGSGIRTTEERIKCGVSLW